MSSLVRRSSLLPLATALALAACKHPAPPRVHDDARGPAKAELGKDAKPAAPAITSAEAETYGKAFAAALAKCDGDEVDALVDSDELNRRIGFGPPMQIGAHLCTGLGDDFSVHYSRVVTVDGAPRPRVRIRVGAGVNFMEPVLEKKGDKILAVDFFTFRQGELMSKAIGALSVLQSDTDAAQAYIEAQTMYNQKEYQLARDAFAKVPEHLRTTIKAIALLGLAIDAKLDEPTYQQAMVDYAKHFPGDTALPLIQIDQYYIAKDHAKLIAAIEAFLARLGDDAYVRTLLATARSEAGDKPGALADAKAAFTAEPELSEARDVLLGEAVDAGDFAQAVAVLDADLAAGDDLPGLMKTWRKQYPKLFASPQFKAWSKAHPAK